jgi:hypothetical protein
LRRAQIAVSRYWLTVIHYQEEYLPMLHFPIRCSAIMNRQFDQVCLSGYQLPQTKTDNE